MNEFAAMGKDAMDLATDFARRNGKEIFLSLRFNDNHDNGCPEIMLSPFKIDNPEVMVGHGHTIKCCGKNAADFSQEKVRAFVRKYVRAKEFIAKYATEGIAPADVAAHLGISRTLLDLRFRETQKTMVWRLITDVKLADVKRKLRLTSLSIGAIHDLCGFRNANALKNLFKERYGMSMRDWRAMRRAQRR